MIEFHQMPIMLSPVAVTLEPSETLPLYLDSSLTYGLNKLLGPRLDKDRYEREDICQQAEVVPTSLVVR